LANLSDSDEGGISLFPMFNILACTLGVMVFILSTVATVTLGADKAVRISHVSPVGPVPDSSLVEEGSEPRTRVRRPLWLEWDGEVLLHYPSLDTVRLERDLTAIETWDQTWSYLSQALAGTRVGNAIAQASLDYENRVVVILARPSGFDELFELQSYVEFLGMDVGIEPIDQRWQRVRVE
jgi:hypothetical protein